MRRRRRRCGDSGRSSPKKTACVRRHQRGGGCSARPCTPSDTSQAKDRQSLGPSNGLVIDDEKWHPMQILVMGASGYIGTHLVPELTARGHNVRAAARSKEALEARSWPGVECRAADVLRPETLDAALASVDVAYYLVHSMGSGRAFPRLERQGARNFRRAAEYAGVRRIIYLGGLQPQGEPSEHLASRAETGEILRDGRIAITELRAGIIVGVGSAAFEVIRDLVFHLPVMVTP